MVKVATIQVVLIVAISRNWDIRQLDVNNVLLNDTPQVVVCIAQPEEYVDALKPNHVCKLNHALYRLKQAPITWFDKLRVALILWVFQNLRFDIFLFIFNLNGKIIYVLVYVDDIMIIKNDELLLHKLTSDLNEEFALKKLGQIHYFLGIETHHDAIEL